MQQRIINLQLKQRFLSLLKPSHSIVDKAKVSNNVFHDSFGEDRVLLLELVDHSKIPQKIESS